MIQRVGILGGTFDPIHVGHLEAAQAARQALDLGRVMLLPSRVPPHRSAEPRASAFHRFAMAAMAADERPSIVASDLELRREGPSYTSMTLEEMHANGVAPADLFFVLGADAFAEIGTWHDYPRLLGLSNFIVVSRPGFPVTKIDPPAGTSDAGTGTFFVVADTPDVSSTDIRRRVAAGESIDGMVCRSVLNHIQRHGLYRPAPMAAL
jgi:nicotinate-nucleotide adenylyltransferase